MARKILLADDSITIQKVISITFASEDYDLTVVGDGESALRKARELKPELVMADVAMPGKTGYEVSAAIKADPELKHMPVLLLAGTFEPLNREEAMKCGADDSIVKPFESQELLDKVRALLARSTPVAAAQTAPAASGPASAPQHENDLWEAGDFLSIPDEFEEKKDEAREPSVDLDFLSSGALFEEESAKELSTPDGDFTDLVLHEDDDKAGAPLGHLGKDEPFELISNEASFDVGSFADISAEQKKDESPFGFESRRPEPFEVEPFDLEPFRPEPEKKAPAADATQLWEEPAITAAPAPAEPKEQVADDLLEIPEEMIETREAVTAETEPFRPSERYESPYSGPVPLRDVMSSPEPAPQVSEDDVRRAVEEVAEKVESRLIEDLNLKLGKAEAQVAEAIERTAAKVEERLKAELSAKLGRAEAQINQALERAAAKVEERLKTELASRLEKSLAVPRERIEAAVARTSKEVVEHIAWEVLPELAERLIKAEINRVKEAFVRPR